MRTKKESTSGQTWRAEAMLRGLLGLYDLPSVDVVKSAARQNGVSWTAVERAKARLRVVSVREARYPARVLGWRLSEPEGL